jgi:hypothetical protein
MSRRILVILLLSWAMADADVAEGVMVPPVEGAYLGFRTQATANPWNAGMGADFGWREVMYQAQAPALAYNYIGMEFLSQAIVQELDFGVRVVLQPTSFLQTSLTYERIGYPFGLISLAGDPGRSEDDIWNLSNGVTSNWADEFTWQWSVLKEIGSMQGRISGFWSRIDIDDTRDSLYLPSQDIVVQSRDDIIGLDFFAGYISQTPFLTAIGPAISTLTSIDHRVQRDRAGVWLQAWPFSQRHGQVIPYWTIRSRVDVWTEHSSRRWEPRLELTIGWESNIFQPPPSSVDKGP